MTGEAITFILDAGGRQWVVTPRGLVPYEEWIRDPRNAPGWVYAHP